MLKCFAGALPNCLTSLCRKLSLRCRLPFAYYTWNKDKCPWRDSVTAWRMTKRNVFVSNALLWKSYLPIFLCSLNQVFPLRMGSCFFLKNLFFSLKYFMHTPFHSCLLMELSLSFSFDTEQFSIDHRARLSHKMRWFFSPFLISPALLMGEFLESSGWMNSHD